MSFLTLPGAHCKDLHPYSIALNKPYRVCNSFSRHCNINQHTFAQQSQFPAPFTCIIPHDRTPWEYALECHNRDLSTSFYFVHLLWPCLVCHIHVYVCSLSHWAGLMGTNNLCVPLVANLYLFTYKFEWTSYLHISMTFSPILSTPIIHLVSFNNSYFTQGFW